MGKAAFHLDCWEASAGSLGLELVHGKSVESVYFWLSVKSLQRPLLRLGMGGKELWNAAGKTGALGEAPAPGTQETLSLPSLHGHSHCPVIPIFPLAPAPSSN